MTQRELAKLAHVSFSTVSKAFGNSGDISEETRNHIFTIAKQYGCFGEFYKGSYPKKVIAIICPEIASGYYAAFVEGFQRLIEKNNCISIISSDHFDRQKADELIEYYASYRKADGMIVFGLKNPLKKGYTAPIVSVFPETDAPADTVTVHFESAVLEAVKLLTDYGHTEIAFLGEKRTTGKAALYQKAMKAIGNDRACVIESPLRFEEAGEDGVRRLLADGRRCTALLCAYDNIAFGAIRELKKSGLRVPEPMSVIGIDNLNTGKYTETSLTTMDARTDEVCMAAWNMLQEKMKNPYRHCPNVLLHAKLIVRESVACVGCMPD